MAALIDAEGLRTVTERVNTNGLRAQKILNDVLERPALPCPTRACYSAPRIIDFSRIVKENITFMAQVYPYRGLLLFIALQKVLQLQIMVGMRRKTGQKIDQATFMFSEQETI